MEVSNQKGSEIQFKKGGVKIDTNLAFEKRGILQG